MFKSIPIESHPIAFDYDKCEKREVCPVNQQAGMSFNLNSSGFIQNDINRLLQAQTDAEKQLVLNKLQERSVPLCDNSQLTDSQIAAQIVPFSAQSPAELIRATSRFNLPPMEKPSVPDDVDDVKNE